MGFDETFTAAIHFDSVLKTFSITSTGFEQTVDILSDIEHSIKWLIKLLSTQVWPFLFIDFSLCFAEIWGIWNALVITPYTSLQCTSSYAIYGGAICLYLLQSKQLGTISNYL